jgi:hypothetical protein
MIPRRSGPKKSFPRQQPGRRRERHYEREYLLSEVCMSVFCTELLGYWVEIWEAADIPDPLKLLYEHRAHLVAKVTGHPANGVLTFLFDNGAELEHHGQLIARPDRD